MDIRKVKKLIELLEESGIAEIEIHEGEESVRISRGSTLAPPAMFNVPQAPMPVAQAPVPSSSPPIASEAVPSDDYSSEGYVITAPMVGIFYTSPSPVASKGQTIKIGEVICIIEAMKIMNQIESDVGGRVLRVLVENGDAVEYGQPLFIIDKS